MVRGRKKKMFGATESTDHIWRVKYSYNGEQDSVYVGAADMLRDVTTEGRTPKEMVVDFARQVDILNNARIARDKGVTVLYDEKTHEFIARMAKYHDDLYASLTRHRLLDPEVVRVEITTVDELCDEFFEYKKNNQRRSIEGDTIKEYISALKIIKDTELGGKRFGDYKISLVKSRDIENLIDAMFERRKKNTQKRIKKITVKGKVKFIRMIFKYAAMQGYIAKSPVTDEHAIIVTEKEYAAQKPTIDQNIFLQIIAAFESEIQELLEKVKDLKPINEANKRKISAVQKKVMLNKQYIGAMYFARYAGCRITSEIKENTKRRDAVETGIKWENVKSDRIRIYSPKKHQERWIPNFSELRKWLSDHKKEIADYYKSDYVFPAFRDCSASTVWIKVKSILQKYEIFETVIDEETGQEQQKRITGWEKLIHSFRATRERELINLVGLVEACKIIGNSVEVMMKHYHDFSDQFFKEASTIETTPAAVANTRWIERE